jgi:predicted short-subunit dehydrogenase-like oxidoreductase (DUF2520 family)
MIGITIIGGGNVGYHMGQALYHAGYQIVQVLSRDPGKAIAAAESVRAMPAGNISNLNDFSTVYILAVPDDVIATVAEELSEQDIVPADAIVVHTSGATPASVLQPYFPNYGVFYPLQTMKREQQVDFKGIPICVQASDDDWQGFLLDMGEAISEDVYLIDDEQRAALHLAAVFVNNFTNAMLQASHDIIAQQQLPFRMLQPLLQKTIHQISSKAPKSVQTGPAIRNDQKTIARHLQQLEGHSELTDIYRAMTAYIQTFKQ